jgi:hypothetical protein
MPDVAAPTEIIKARMVKGPKGSKDNGTKGKDKVETLKIVDTDVE